MEEDKKPDESKMSELQKMEELWAKKRSDFMNSFGCKCIIVLALVLLFQIPMLFIKNLIKDRTSYHENAIDSILVPKGGRPELQGILIAIPYTKTVTTYDSNNKPTSKIVEQHLFVTPEKFAARTTVRPEMLKRGIFEVPVFNCEVDIAGSFDEIDPRSIVAKYADSESSINWDGALLLVGISNKKILTCLPEIKIGGTVLRQSLYEPEIGSPFANTIYYDVGELSKTGFDFAMAANIQGGQSVSITPLATENKLGINSTWKNPGFAGGWLPTEREIKSDGFNAEWSIPGLSTKFPKRWSSSEDKSPSSKDEYEYNYNKSKMEKINAETVTVNLFQPVDNYQKATRSAKYSILFLLVPFIALLIFEVFSKTKIHPVQYGLIGLANVVFYLLLISVSEHIPFNLTYWISSAAVSLLILFYGTSIFHRFTYGAFFAAVNLTSYTFLFGTLQAEDYALLIGSLGIFAVVAALMILTRKIDWYRLKELYKD